MSPAWPPLRRLAAVPVDVWTGLLLVLLLVFLAHTTRSGEVPGSQALTVAELIALDSPGATAQPVTLPHVWRNERRDWNGAARYTLPLPPDLAASAATGRPLAVLLPRVGVRFRLLFNDHELLAEHWHDGHGYADAGTRAHWALLPAALWSAPGQANRLQVEVQGQALRISGLGPVRIGPADVLQQRHQWLTGWQVELTWMVAATALVMGLLALLIWLNTAEKLFGLLAAGLLVLTVRLLLSTPVALPGPFLAWDYLHKLSFTLYCGLTYLFIAELFQLRQSLVRSAVRIMLWLAPCWLLIVTLSEDYRLYRWWTGIIAAVCTVALVRVLSSARWGMDTNRRLMVVVGLATLITGVRDFLVVQLGLPGDADIRWMTSGSLVLMFTMGWVLARRATDAFDEARRLNAELARTVDRREHDLHEAVERLRVVQTQRVLEAERQRLTRDMHDGLGSQLVHTLNLVRRAGPVVDARALENMLNQALDELRLTLDSLEPMEGDLPTVLGTFRQRVEPALAGSGIELDWQVTSVPPVPGLEAQGVMHLFRWLQEAFANVIKHAQASRVTVVTRCEGGRVALSVMDNGVGLGRVDPGSGPPGRGLANMRLRAGEMGAELLFAPAQPGTCITLRFPSGAGRERGAPMAPPIAEVGECGTSG